MGGNSSRNSSEDKLHSSAARHSVSCDGRDFCEGQKIAERHEGPVHCICPLNQDSMLSGGADKNVNLYNWTQNYHVATFQGPAKDITEICCNNTSKFVYASSRDRSLYGWQWPTEVEGEKSNQKPVLLKEPKLTLQGHTLGVTALDTCDDHPQLLCSGSRDNSICLWDVDVGKPVSSMYAPRNLVTDLKWITGEKSVVQASEDKTLRVWDLTSCSTVHHFRARNHLLTCCDVSNDGQHFLTGSSGSGSTGGELTLWDRRNEKRPVQQFQGHSDSVAGCMFMSHQDIDIICSAGKDSSIHVWALNSGQELCCQHMSGSSPLTDLAWPAAGILACSSLKDGISLWTLTTTDNGSLKLTINSQYYTS